MSDGRITIRGLDLDVYAETRQIVRDNEGWTMGAFITTALEHYIASLPIEDDIDEGVTEYPL